MAAMGMLRVRNSATLKTAMTPTERSVWLIPANGLLQAAFVHVGDAVDDLIQVDAQADRGHLCIVAAGAAVYQAACQRERSTEPAVELVGGEGRLFVDIRDLEIAHAVVARDHDERAGDKGDGELAGFFGAHELRRHDGEQRKCQAPHGGAEGVPKIVATGGVLLVFRFLHGEAAAVDGAEQTVPPSVDHAADGAGLPIVFAGVALTQLLDACELFGRVGSREEAVLDAAALGLRGAVFRCSGVGDAVAAGDGAANAIEGRDAQSGVLSIAAL